MKELDVIQQAAILSEADFAFLEQTAAELRNTAMKRQIFRTETEMRVAVLDDIHYPTKASKYWQAVREQSVMLEALVTAGFDYRRNEVKIKRLTARLGTATDEFEKEEIQIDLDEAQFAKINLELVARDRIRELRLWSTIKAELDDGSFDTENVNTHQLVSYAQRFILQASNAPRDMPVAEANNLKGQLLTSLREAESKGLLNEVLAPLPQPVVNKVLIETGVLRIENQGA
jgi:hypothetical protein